MDMYISDSDNSVDNSAERIFDWQEDRTDTEEWWREYLGIDFYTDTYYPCFTSEDDISNSDWDKESEEMTYM